MKIQSLHLIACLLLVGGINSSCNSCNDKKDPQVDSSTQQVTVTDSTANSGYNDVAAEENGIANAEMNATGKASVSKSSGSNSKGSGSNAKSKKGDKLKGYGAADGTDAENHDGDQYTRNDTTRMPNGSIK